MTTTLSPAETCRQVANIIDSEPHRFDMSRWESDCGTRACIAGHIGILHGDALSPDRPRYHPSNRWVDRQARRLGLTDDAGRRMFRPYSPLWTKHNPRFTNVSYGKVLRQLGQELENRDENKQRINIRELHRIAEEALT